MAASKGAIIISLNAAIYLVHLIFNALAGRGATDLFPRSVGDASDHYELLMTPVGATFSIWGVIFTFQLLWIIYSISTIFRNGDQTNILSTKFYISFITNIIFITIWLFLWTRLQAVPSFIVITIGQIALDLSIGIACSDLFEYENSHEITETNKIDIWLQRILVQNGLIFYATWTTVATLINTAVVLTYELDVSNQTSSLVALSLLGVLVIAWFIVENFVIEKYTEYTVAEYVALIYALSGIIAGVWGKNEAVAGLTLTLLIISVLFLAIRLVIVVLRNSKRTSYETIEFNARNQTITQ